MPAVHAGTFSWVDDLFTFREDQKERVAPRRRLPPVEVSVPHYPARDVENWSNYYTREDLVADTYVPGSASKVMRPGPEAADSPQQYWRLMQDRMARQQANAGESSVFVGEPGTGPGMENTLQGDVGNAIQIGAPKGDWRSEGGRYSSEDSSARRYGMQPRPGDYDYVGGDWVEKNRWKPEDMANGGRVVASQGGGGYVETKQAPSQYRNDPRYVGFNERGQVNKYKVQKGDTLSGIAGQKAIYDNWKLWPLIYSANKTAIGGRPTNLKIDQKLGIPRDYSGKQAKEAESRAGKR